MSNSERSAEKKTPLYTKQQLLQSRRFADRRDALSVLLTDNERYTIDRAEKLIDGFLKGRVK